MGIIEKDLEIYRGFVTNGEKRFANYKILLAEFHKNSHINNADGWWDWYKEDLRYFKNSEEANLKRLRKEIEEIKLYLNSSHKK